MPFTTSRIVLSVAIAIAATGCESGRFPYREAHLQTQGSYLDQLLGNADVNALAAERTTFSAPASLAVVQVGEIAPPQPMLEQLRKHSAVFSRVEAIPAVSADHWRGRGDPDRARTEINTLRALAGSLGMDYLLLIGGTVDEIHNATPLSMLNLTIVGAFVVPSHRTYAVMKASGALVEVRSGRIVSISNAEAKDEQIRPLISAGGDMDRRLETMRDEVTVALADAVAVDCQKIGNAVVPLIAPSPSQISGTPSPSRDVPLSKRTFQGR